MTDINNGDAPTYFSYFTKYVNPPRAEETSLWTTNRLDGSENYLPQIATCYFNQDCYSEPSDTYHCHICNINVPKMCYQKHNQSNQHETIKKTYEKVLERVSKQMYVNSVNTDKDIDQSLYYCEPCSTIIKIENKQNHEATEYHANSIKRSIIIDNFYNIITENIRFDVREELSGVESNPFNPNNNYNDTQDVKMEVCSSIDCEDIKDNLFDQHSILPPVQAQNIETKSTPIEEEKEQSFIEYLKEMIKKYNLKVTLPVVDGDFITIVAPNGDRVKVSRDNFHGYLKNNSTYCLLCSESWLPKNTSLHDVTEKHVRNIFRPINDNFARVIDDDWSHCIPCNELFPTLSDLHTPGAAHKTIINNTIQTNKTLCEDCNIYIDSHNFSVHLNSIKHRIMKENSIQETRYNNIFCKICNITLPKNVLNLHIGTQLHLAKKAKKFTDVKDENNKNNANNETNKKKKEVEEKITKLKSKVGSTNIGSNERSVVGPKEGKNHTKTRTQKLEAYNKLMIYADIEKTLICQICDVNVRDADSAVIQHVEGRNHKFTEKEVLKFHSITRLSSGFICGCCNFRTTDYIDHIGSSSHTLEFAKKKTIDGIQMRKFVYDGTVNNIGAQLHRKLYTNLLRHNGVFSFDYANFYCLVCQISVSRTSEINHVLGERHANSMDTLRAQLRDWQ